MDLWKFWGKARNDRDKLVAHPLICHMLDVGAVAEVWLNKDALLQSRLKTVYGVNKGLYPLLVFFIILHDIGKFGRGFQSLVPELSPYGKGYPYNIRHDAMGKVVFPEYVYEILEKKFSFEDEDGELEGEDLWDYFDCLVDVVCGHHGQPVERKNTSSVIRKHFSLVRKDIEELILILFELLLKDWQTFTFQNLDKLKQTSWVISGLCTLSDWIGSGVEFFPYQLEKSISLEVYWQESVMKAEKALQQIGLLHSEVEKNGDFFTLFPFIEEPSPLQQLVLDHDLEEDSHLIIIEDATGNGKTEAAIEFVRKLLLKKQGDGVFFGLPTMATANAMYFRLVEALPKLFTDSDKVSIHLTHSSQDTVLRMNAEKDYNYADQETASNQMNTWLQDSRKRSLLADIGVGTIDQALLGVLQTKHATIRLFGLQRKIVVIDEVHAFDGYTKELIKNLIKIHCGMGGSLILLSATLPLSMRSEFLNCFTYHHEYQLDTKFPLVTIANSKEVLQLSSQKSNEKKREVQFQFVYSQDDCFKKMNEWFESGACFCWLRNTVQDVLDVYPILVQKFGVENVTVFHSRFALGDRIETEKKVLELFGKNSSEKQRIGKIVLGTQVLEQSLDVDFDYMLTDLAPIDLLIQRLGRVQRHDRGDRGVVRLHILAPRFVDEPSEDWYQKTFQKGGFVYPDHALLWRTQKILLQKKIFNLPQDSRYLIEAVYGQDVEIPIGLENRTYQYEGDKLGEQGLAFHNQIHFKNGYQFKDVWGSDVKTPTRLGESTLWQLYVQDENGLSLLCDYEDDFMINLHLSQLQLRSNLLLEVEGAELIEKKSKWTEILILKKKDGKYIGYGKNIKKRVRIEYSKSLGLVIGEV